jgi:hypothetical protein
MASSKHPGEDVLRELAGRQGMTFVKMAKEFAVDRKTMRRWCRDIGINECGNVNPSAVAGQPEVEQVIKEYQPVNPVIEALENKVAWLIEWNTIMHERLRELEKYISGFVCSINCRTQNNSFAEIVNKIETGMPFTDAEKVFIDDFRIMCEDAIRNELNAIWKRLENHYHPALSIADTKVFFDDKQKRARG